MAVVVVLVLTVVGMVVMVVVVGLVVYRMALVPRSARTQAARLEESSAPLVLCSAYNTNKLARSLGSKSSCSCRQNVLNPWKDCHPEIDS